MSKPSIPKGTRDFGPEVVLKRQYIIQTLKQNFEAFGYQPLETPVMENMSTLTGKYGDEGDKLLFRVLNLGHKLKKAKVEALESGDLKTFQSSLAEKGLRYDLTIPFARYVVMNRGTMTMPFKRYQIQPVWRGDRPQRGRYREFYQCDADVVGTRSLLNEAELVQIYDMGFSKLGIPVQIRMNNRKILAGLADLAGSSDKFKDITIAIDKLDKIGLEGVLKELANREVSEIACETIKGFLTADGSNEDKINLLKERLASSEIGMLGIKELETLFAYLSKIDIQNELVLDITLARGLDYYTGMIFEVAAKGVKMGSIGGGGRYDDLTGTFGLKDVSGVGISFGLDRIYDVMEELDLFKSVSSSTTKAMFVNFGGKAEEIAFEALQAFRKKEIPAEIFPDSSKMNKQMKYANAKGIPYVIFTGEAEWAENKVGLKNMESGEQNNIDLAEALEIVSKA